MMLGPNRYAVKLIYADVSRLYGLSLHTRWLEVSSDSSRICRIRRSNPNIVDGK